MTLAFSFSLLPIASILYYIMSEQFVWFIFGDRSLSLIFSLVVTILHLVQIQGVYPSCVCREILDGIYFQVYSFYIGSTDF